MLAQTGTVAGGPSYVVPAGGGQITSWSVGTVEATAPSPVSFVVLRPAGNSYYTVVGIDNETITSTGGVQTFALASPIQVQGGDVLGLYLNGSENFECYWTDLSGPAADGVSFFFTGGVPTPRQTFPAYQTIAAALVNVSATLVTVPQDAAVTTSAGPSGASAGQDALLSSTVTNNGPGSAPITFTDSVPSGLTVDFAGAGNGSCSTSGQTVTCTITGLTAGQSAPVDVLVTASAPGSYAHKVSVAPLAGIPDPNPANNSASATLNVGLSLSANCVVPNLKGVALGTARTVLGDLGCMVKVSHAHSKSVKKGSVVKTKPGPGAYAYMESITLVVSSGPKKKHHKK